MTKALGCDTVAPGSVRQGYTGGRADPARTGLGRDGLGAPGSQAQKLGSEANGLVTGSVQPWCRTGTWQLLNDILEPSRRPAGVG